MSTKPSREMFLMVLSLKLLLLGLTVHADTQPPPPQDQGLPYTRTSIDAALAKVRDGIALFPGSRYGYVMGHRVRLDDADLLRGEAVDNGGPSAGPGGVRVADRA
jgi:hypothetical protein